MIWTDIAWTAGRLLAILAGFMTFMLGLLWLASRIFTSSSTFFEQWLDTQQPPRTLKKRRKAS